MTDEPQRHTTSSTEAAAAVAAQIRDVRDVLRDDAAAAGIDIERVDMAVDTALATYTDARVHSFIGVLVERDVRTVLHLRQGGTIDDAPREATA